MAHKCRGQNIISYFKAVLLFKIFQCISNNSIIVQHPKDL